MPKYVLAMLVTALLGSVCVSSMGADYTDYSGRELYARFCAACHGAHAHGDGPVSKYLNVEVPDLRFLARRNHGVFPDEQVRRIVDGRTIIGAHGTRIMPVWGQEFMHSEGSAADGNETATGETIGRIINYLSTLQVE